MKILIGGDVCPVGRNERLFLEKNSLRPARDLLAAGGAELTLVNLECPLIGKATPIAKGGPVLAAATATAEGLAYLGVNVAALANNHIMDHGPAGLQSTLAAVQAVGIQAVGAGADLRSASEPLLIPVGEEQVAVLAFAEREYSYATTDTPGACPLDLNLVVRKLRAVPRNAFIIVLLHAGNEHCPYPSPWLQDTCRLIVELGAHVVVCQHSHCIGAYEEYRGGLVVYGQGNMIFDRPSRHPSWWEGLLLEIETSRGALAKYAFTPIIQAPGAEGIRKATPAGGARILSELDQYAQVVRDPARLAAEWELFCQGQKRSYQSLLFGFHRFEHILNKLTGFADCRSRQGKMNIGNALRCASHLEVLRTIYSRERTTRNG